jgi:two-component system cell cycle response regulator DivK
MGRRILVVEDDLLNRMFYSAVLESGGFVAETVADGDRAIAAVKRFEPDLIVMDIQLPSISGLDLIEILQDDPELKEIPILAVTAFVGKGEERRIREAGASDFLAKPVSIKPFLAAIEALLERERPG